MKEVVLVMVIIALAGCASSVVPASKAVSAPADRVYKYQNAKPESGVLTVVRDNSFTGGGCYASIFINGDRVATLDSKEKASFYLPNGVWMVGAQIQGGGLCGYSGERQEREVTLNSHSDKFVRVFTDGDGNLDIRPTTIK